MIADLEQSLAQELNPWRRWMDVAVRTDGDSAALAPAIRREVLALDRNGGKVRMNFDLSNAGMVAVTHAVYGSDSSSSWERTEKLRKTCWRPGLRISSLTRSRFHLFFDV